MARYPADIAREVSNPFTGIPGRQNFLPTVAEVRKACEQLMANERDKRNRDSDFEKQMERRRVDQELDVQRDTRAEYIARLKASGRLKFGIEAKENGSWFDRLTLADAERNLGISE